MPKYCPECGGVLKFDRINRMFICASCGAMFSREELDEIYEERKYRDEKEDEREAYLKWWLSKEKE